jgi:hypothetical protein
MIFRPHHRAREHCPIIHPDAQGREIQMSDQTGIMRVIPGDRVRIVEDRDDHCLCSHSACTLGLLLIARAHLLDEPAEPAAQPVTVEDAEL